MKNNHVHQYRKVNLSRTKGKEYFVYACQKPLCSHYVPDILMENKLAECPRCNSGFTIQKKHLDLIEPHCDNCVIRTR